MDGFRFSTEIRVRFAETDAQAIAHNASYLVWFEVARVEYLRDTLGVGVRKAHPERDRERVTVHPAFSIST